jgi:hypothetical protein
MRRAVVVAGVLGLVGVVRADEQPPAREKARGTARGENAAPAPGHARHSTTLYLSTPWSPDPTVPIRGGADAAVRVHRRNVALEARLGAAGAGSVVGLSGHFAGHLGASLGGAIPISDHVVLAPMLAYDAYYEWEQRGAELWIHYITLELPIAIVLRRGVVLELLLQGGAAHYLGATDPAFVAGPRLGITL